MLTLGGNNSYTGGTTVSAGTLQMGSVNALGNNPGTLAVTGTLDLNGNNLTVSGGSNALTGAGIVTTNVSGPATFTVSNTGTTNDAFSGTIIAGAGTLSFVKSGTGSMSMAGTNTYTGTTTVSAGTLTLAKAANLPGYNSPNMIYTSSNAVLQAQVGTGAWTIANIDALLTNNIGNFNGILSYYMVSGANQTESYNLTGNMGVRLGGSSSYILQLTGNNSYAGGTYVASGTLQMGPSNPGTLGTGGINMGLQTGTPTLDLNGNSPTIGTLTRPPPPTPSPATPPAARSC